MRHAVPLSIVAPSMARSGRFAILLIGLATLAACGSAVSGAGAGRGAEEPTLLGVELRSTSPDLLGPVAYDLPIEANSWVEAEMRFLLRERRDVLANWIARGERYAEFVRQIFREEGVPTDLYHLAMIESGFIPRARSSAGAVGFWQFMPATSRDVGLRVDSNVDERMDPVRSTRAAARHLRALYRIHGDWALAAAAYNAGSSRISRSMQLHGARNFWELAQHGDLAEETRRYVPRLYAMTIIGRDPGRFGFHRPPVEPFAYDSLQVDRSVSLRELSDITGIDTERLAELNPHLIREATPAGSYWVWVPDGSGPRAELAYAAAMRGDSGLGLYTVRWGDTLGEMARLSGISAARIRELNPGTDFDRLQAGTRITLPQEAVRALASRSDDAPRLPDAGPVLAGGDAAPNGTRQAPTPPSVPTNEPLAAPGSASPASPEFVVHRVREGETLASVAQSYDVSVLDIRAVNEIAGSIIAPGQELRIPRVQRPEPAAPPPPPQPVRVADAPPPPAPAPAEPATPSAPAAPEPDRVQPARPTAQPTADLALTEHRVLRGETLADLAAQYGTTIEAIRETNGLRGSTLAPGQRLLIAIGAAPEPRSTSNPRTADSEVREHRVATGETLSSIASRYGTTVSAIQEANGISGSVIRPGQRLRIPGGASGATSEPDEPRVVEHVVASGETLSGIAARYGTTVSAIQSTNGIRGSVIRPGQRLQVPAGADAPAFTEHVVRSGETLSGIASRYGTTVSAIRSANRIEGSVIRPGQRLRIETR